jgi:hypothetical protein
MYIEAREARKRLWELNLGIYLPLLISLLFFYYLVGTNESMAYPIQLVLTRATEVFGFSLLITAIAVCQYKWLSSLADELCLSVDRFSIAIAERLLSSKDRSASGEMAQPVPTSKETTKLYGSLQTRPLTKHPGLTLLHLMD